LTTAVDAQSAAKLCSHLSAAGMTISTHSLSAIS